MAREKKHDHKAYMKEWGAQERRRRLIEGQCVRCDKKAARGMLCDESFRVVAYRTYTQCPDCVMMLGSVWSKKKGVSSKRG